MLGLVTVLAGYPWLVELAKDNATYLRPIAIGISVVAALIALAQWRLGRQLRDTLHLFVASGLAVAAAIWQVHSLLLLIPALAFFGLSWLCWKSLRGESVIEQMAKLIQPLAPAFIAPYCRKCTICWALLFLAYGGVQVTLTALNDHAGWQFFSRRVGPIVIGAVIVIEFFVPRLTSATTKTALSIACSSVCSRQNAQRWVDARKRTSTRSSQRD